MAAPAQTDVRWDLTPFYTSVNDPAYAKTLTELPDLLTKIEALLDSLTPNLSAEQLKNFLTEFEETYKTYRLISSYTSLVVSADANDNDAQKALSSLQSIATRSEKFSRRFESFIGTLDPKLWENAPELADDKFPLNRIHSSAKHLLSPELEAHTADLEEFGSTAWERLYDDFSSNIQVDLNEKSVPISAIRGLAYDTKADTRATAFAAELAAWKANEIPLAAAMNSIKGEASHLAALRGWPEQLDVTLHYCNMDRASLEAMLEAAKDSFPDWRRYLKAKAKLLGHTNGLPFHDLFAPIGADTSWTWQQAESFVEEGFRAYSDKLGDFAKLSYNENWHDAFPRPGKRDGAFCAGVTPGVSRMLHNFKESVNGAMTLAHELGHAYHNLCLENRTGIQKRTPMTLAETASIFCETIIKRKAISESTGDAKLAILEASLQGSCQVTVDITSRFLFESAVIEKRKVRALTPEEFCDLMRQAQLDTYGDGLDPEKLHPYMWAAKPHYYSTFAFYNFPYMFGLLFALGLYRIYQESPDGFHERYDSLLSRTGMAMAADLTQEFGIDITQKSFWAGSLAVLRDDIDEFCNLVG
ncbi:oligoendopeptidase F [bacterium]|nr:oligoendopeptidase F [bacterium]